MINLATTTWLWPPLHLNLSAARESFSSDAPSYGSRRSQLPCAHASRLRSHEAVQVNEPDAVNRREVLHLLLLTISCQRIVETKQAIAEGMFECRSLSLSLNFCFIRSIGLCMYVCMVVCMSICGCECRYEVILYMYMCLYLYVCVCRYVCIRVSIYL